MLASIINNAIGIFMKKCKISNIVHVVCIILLYFETTYVTLFLSADIVYKLICSNSVCNPLRASGLVNVTVCSAVFQAPCMLYRD